MPVIKKSDSIGGFVTKQASKETGIKLGTPVSIGAGDVPTSVIEMTTAENEIRDLKKSSIQNVNKIAVETSANIITQIIDTDVNKSNVSAIVEDVSKRKTRHL